MYNLCRVYQSISNSHVLGTGHLLGWGLIMIDFLRQVCSWFCRWEGVSMVIWYLSEILELARMMNPSPELTTTFYILYNFNLFATLGFQTTFLLNLIPFNFRNHVFKTYINFIYVWNPSSKSYLYLILETPFSYSIRSYLGLLFQTSFFFTFVVKCFPF